MLFDEVGQLQQQALAPGGQHATPWSGIERAPCRLHGQVDLDRTGIGLVRNHLAGGGIVHGDGLALPFAHGLAIDEHGLADGAQFRAVGPGMAGGGNACSRHSELQRKGRSQNSNGICGWLVGPCMAICHSAHGC
ncbi:hypothetical protein D9M69_587330 [compost metagenome]